MKRIFKKPDARVISIDSSDSLLTTSTNQQPPIGDTQEGAAGAKVSQVRFDF